MSDNNSFHSFQPHEHAGEFLSPAPRKIAVLLLVPYVTVLQARIAHHIFRSISTNIDF